MPLNSFSIENLRTKEKTHDELIAMTLSNRKLLDSHLMVKLNLSQFNLFKSSGILPDDIEEDIIKFSTKLKKIEEQLKINDNFISLIRHRTSKTELIFNTKFSIEKYGDDFTREIIKDNLIFQSDVHKMRYSSCLGFGLVNNFSSIDPKLALMVDPNKSDKLKLRETPETEAKRKLKDQIQKDTLTSIYLNRDKLSFIISNIVNKVCYCLSYDPKNKIVKIEIEVIFIRDTRLYPEEFQIEMFKELINYCSKKGVDGKTKLQRSLEENYSAIPNNDFSEFDLLRIISESKIKFSQNHIVNPKSLTLISRSLDKEEGLTPVQKQNLLVQTPNSRNTYNFILQLNKLLEENGYEKLTLPPPKVHIVGVDYLYPEYSCFGTSIQAFLPFSYRLKNVNAGKNIAIVSLDFNCRKIKSSDLPDQLSINPTSIARVLNATRTQLVISDGLVS